MFLLNGPGEVRVDGQGFTARGFSRLSENVSIVSIQPHFVSAGGKRFRQAVSVFDIARKVTHCQNAVGDDKPPLHEQIAN